MAQPSLIPVPISKRTSVSLSPGTLILQQSTNSVNSQGRSPSPLATKNGKRLSIYSGNGNGHTSNGPARKASAKVDDPGMSNSRPSLIFSTIEGKDLQARGRPASRSCPHGRRLSWRRDRRVYIVVFAYTRITTPMDTDKWDLEAPRDRLDAWRRGRSIGPDTRRAAATDTQIRFKL
jgi:hypothetical protein